MATIEQTSATDFDAEFEAAIARDMKGLRDPEAMERAAREIDEGREEIRSRPGELEIAVDLIRDARDA
jgi:hypothetical protein